MSDQDKATNKIESDLNRSQVLFTANPLFLNPQTKTFLQAQESFFDEFEKFATSWFQRRQEATMSMISAGRRIASEGKGDVAGAMKELATWQTVAMQQMAEDARECTELMRNCAGALGKKEDKAADKTEAARKPAKNATHSTPL